MPPTSLLARWNRSKMALSLVFVGILGPLSYLERDPARGPTAHGPPRFPCSPANSERVVDQHARQPVQPFRSDDHVGATDIGEIAELDATLRGHRRETLDAGSGCYTNINRVFAGVCFPLGVHPCQPEQIFYDPAEPLAFAADMPQHLSVLLRRPGTAQCQVHFRLDHAERRPQLVGCVRRELGLAASHQLDGGRRPQSDDEGSAEHAAPTRMPKATSGSTSVERVRVILATLEPAITQYEPTRTASIRKGVPPTVTVVGDVLQACLERPGAPGVRTIAR